jgi:hypothetical protein
MSFVLLLLQGCAITMSAYSDFPVVTEVVEEAVIEPITYLICGSDPTYDHLIAVTSFGEGRYRDCQR